MNPDTADLIIAILGALSTIIGALLVYFRQQQNQQGLIDENAGLRLLNNQLESDLIVSQRNFQELAAAQSPNRPTGIYDELGNLVFPPLQSDCCNDDTPEALGDVVSFEEPLDMDAAITSDLNGDWSEGDDEEAQDYATRHG